MRRRTRHHPSKLPSDLPNVKNTHISDNNRQKLCFFFCSSSSATLHDSLSSSGLKSPPPHHTFSARTTTSTISYCHGPLVDGVHFHLLFDTPLLSPHGQEAPLLLLSSSLTIIVHSSSMNSSPFVDAIVVWILLSLPYRPSPSHLPASYHLRERQARQRG